MTPEARAEIEAHFGTLADMLKPQVPSEGSASNFAAPSGAFSVTTGSAALIEAANLADTATLRKEIARLNGIIARNTQQRLAGEDAKSFFVTAQDIKDSLEILYAHQDSPNSGDEGRARAHSASLSK